MSAVVLPLPRKKARTLAETSCALAFERTTDALCGGMSLKQKLRVSAALEDMVPEIEAAFDESWAAFLELGGR